MRKQYAKTYPYNSNSDGFGFDWSDLNPFSSENATQVGMDVLRAYYDTSRAFPSFQYSNFDSYINALNTKINDNFVDLIGQLVLDNSASTDKEDAISRVRDLAAQSGGKATMTQIVTAAGGTGNTINWSAAIPEITWETVKDVAEKSGEGLEAVGQTVLAAGEGLASTGKLLKYLPWILGGAGVIAILFYGQPILKMLSKK